MKLKFKKDFRCYLENQLHEFRKGQKIDAPARESELGHVLDRNDVTYKVFPEEKKEKVEVDKGVIEKLPGMEIDELRKVGKKLKIQGWHFCKKETLIEKIKESIKSE